MLPITRGIRFFSKTASMTLAGESGKRYHFKKTEKTAQVVNAIDIAFFRKHPQVVEEGKTNPTAAELAAKKRPVSYVTTGNKAQSFPPPSQAQTQRASRRRDEYNAMKKAEAEAVSAKALSETGVGTKSAQARRKKNAAISANKFPEPDVEEALVEKVAPPVKVVAPPIIDETPETIDEDPEVVKDPGLICQFCGRKFKKPQGLSMHERRWCKKNPASQEYDPNA